MRTFFSKLQYIKHNFRLFNRPLKTKKKIILVEFNRLASSIISYSYLSNALKNIHNANIIAYRVTTKRNRFKDITWILLSKIFFILDFLVYRSFGVKSFWFPGFLYKENKNIKNIIKKIKNKNDLFNLKVDDVYVGDLIYDSYLMDYKQATVDTKSQKFLKYLKHTLSTFFEWKKIFKNYDVKGVITSHSIYNLAIPLRLAVSKNIDAFQCSAEHLYRLSKKELYAYKQFKNYKKDFKKINRIQQKKLLNLAKIKIHDKLSGQKLTWGSTKSPYSNKILKSKIKKTNNLKVLIATHCFFDNPHPYGKNLFVDFYEWIDFLGKISKKTNYDWYIKLHANYLPGTKEIIEYFIKKYPSIKYLPNNYSHHQIIKEGVNIALTCFGTIASEYPMYDRNVINCSTNNPHIDYNFSISPKSLKEYKKLLLNLGKIKNNINKNEIYEFYVMNNILRTPWLMDDYEDLVTSSKGYYFQFTPEMFSHWLKKNFSVEKHEILTNKINQFIESNDYSINWNKKAFNNYAK
jgi:hypothetical protein